MRFKPSTWMFALLYTALSLATETLLLIVGQLRIPRDNVVIAPVVLLVPPVLAAWLFGDRRPTPFIVLAGLTSLLTLLLTIAAARLTGVRTGLIEPIAVRSAAGFLGITIARRI